MNGESEVAWGERRQGKVEEGSGSSGMVLPAQTGPYPLRMAAPLKGPGREAMWLHVCAFKGLHHGLG